MTRTKFALMLGDRRGSILVSALMLVFVISVLAFALYELAVVENRLTLGSNCDARALYAAEAGLRVAYRDLVNGTTTGSVDFDGVLTGYISRTPLAGYATPRPLSGSNARPTTYTVDAQVIGGEIRLWSTGAATSSCPGGPGSATVRADIRRTLNPTGGEGGNSLVGLDNFSMTGSVLDSFDSSKGKYDCLGGVDAGCTAPNGTRNKCQQTTAPFGCNVGIWTNGGSVRTQVSAPIYGDLVAASGEVRFSTSGTLWGGLKYDTTDGSFSGNASQVKGGVTAQGPPGIAPIGLPPVPWPGVDAAGKPGEDCRTHPHGVGGAGTAGFSSNSYVAARIFGPYSYDETTGKFTSNSALTIDPGASPAQFCFSGLFLSGNLTIPGTATNQVEIYIGSDASGSLTSNSKVSLTGNITNNTFQARYLRIFSIANVGNDDIIVQGPGGALGGYFFAYAPYGQVQIKSSSGNFFGAAFGKELNISSGAIHFDAQLLQVPGLPGLTSGVGGSPTYMYFLDHWAQCRNSPCT